MKPKMMLWLIALLALGAGVNAKLVMKSKTQKHQAFTLYSRVIYDDASTHYEGNQTRFVWSDGSYRVVYNDDKGGHKEYFFKQGLGFFNVSHAKKELIQDSRISPNAFNSPPETAEDLQKRPQFIRKETVIGLTAYVQRVMDEKTKRPLTDLYFAVELGKMPLKEVIYTNGQAVLTIEPVKIAWGEPDTTMLVVPNYPIVQKEKKE
jgi:hypothetical protein